jgi:DNA-binding NtrC family response regulator
MEETKSLNHEALLWLSRYHYEGNIRELRNILERACLLCDGAIIEPRHLEYLNTKIPTKTKEFVIRPLAEVEQDYISKVSRHFSGDNRQLAELLGISERTLYRKIQLSKNNHT